MRLGSRWTWASDPGEGWGAPRQIPSSLHLIGYKIKLGNAHRLVVRVPLRGFLDLLEQASDPLVLVSDFRR